MKSLGIIKDDVYNDFHFRDNDEERRLKITETEEYKDEVTKRFAKEVAKQALINATRPKDEYGNDIDLIYENGSYHIKEELITDESNIPTLLY